MGIFIMNENQNETNKYEQIKFSYSDYGAANNVLAVIAMILGVCSLLSLFTIYLSLIFGSIAIILALLSKGYGKKMVTSAKVGFGTAIGSLGFIGGFIGVVFMSMYIIFTSYSSTQLVQMGKNWDSMIETQLGESTKSLFGTSYEEIMEQVAALKTNE